MPEPVEEDLEKVISIMKAISKNSAMELRKSLYQIFLMVEILLVKDSVNMVKIYLIQMKEKKKA
jgi:hypothetical protein